MHLGFRDHRGVCVFVCVSARVSFCSFMCTGFNASIIHLHVQYMAGGILCTPCVT